MNQHSVMTIAQSISMPQAWGMSVRAVLAKAVLCAAKRAVLALSLGHGKR